MKFAPDFWSPLRLSCAKPVQLLDFWRLNCGSESTYGKLQVVLRFLEAPKKGCGAVRRRQKQQVEEGVKLEMAAWKPQQARNREGAPGVTLFFVGGEDCVVEICPPPPNRKSNTNAIVCVCIGVCVCVNCASCFSVVLGFVVCLCFLGGAC